MAILSHNKQITSCRDDINEQEKKLRNQLLFLLLKEKEVIILNRKDITEKIGDLNLKIAKANEDLSEIELKYKMVLE